MPVWWATSTFSPFPCSTQFIRIRLHIHTLLHGYHLRWISPTLIYYYRLIFTRSTLPSDIVIDRPFLSEKPKVLPLLAMSQTLSPDKPLPTPPPPPPFNSSSSTLADGNSPDNDFPRNPIDLPPPSATFQPKLLSSGSPSALTLSSSSSSLSTLFYGSDLALRDVHLPVVLVKRH
jgi:hypothetical protein